MNQLHSYCDTSYPRGVVNQLHSYCDCDTSLPPRGVVNQLHSYCDTNYPRGVVNQLQVTVTLATRGVL